MDNFLSRYRNVSILVAILFAQVLGLAVQVRRSSDSESTRLIRVWAVGAVTPFEKGIVWAQSSSSYLWHNYFYLRGVRQENRDLKYQIQRLQLEQVRLSQDAEQARRLQALLGFKEQFISKTLAAQAIGFSGSELSRAVYIDKGSSDGLKRDMAVITSGGVVGKILRVYSSTSLVLLIDDQTSGVGVFLENSRLQGVLRGTPAGGVVLEKILGDEVVQPGEKVLTSGGDRIFPKGLPAGTVTAVSRGSDSFLNIRVKPAADLGKLEEVLVITQEEDKTPVVDKTAPVRAVDILAQRLPSVPDKPPAEAGQGNAPETGQAQAPNDGKPSNSTSSAATAKPVVPSAPGKPSTLQLPGSSGNQSPSAQKPASYKPVTQAKPKAGPSTNAPPQ
jgi:rod shape-determining protein MreC